MCEREVCFLNPAHLADSLSGEAVSSVELPIRSASAGGGAKRVVNVLLSASPMLDAHGMVPCAVALLCTSWLHLFPPLLPLSCVHLLSIFFRAHVNRLSPSSGRV